jgi:hypothetical protein
MILQAVPDHDDVDPLHDDENGKQDDRYCHCREHRM